MKRTAVILFAVALAASTAYAETTKDAAQKVGNFWQKEGERSGWKDSTSSWGQFWSNLHPIKFFKDQEDAYNARKPGAVAH